MEITKSQRNSLILLLITLVVISSVIYWSVRIEVLKEQKMREICEKDYNMSFLYKTQDSFFCLLANNGSVKQIEIKIKK